MEKQTKEMALEKAKEKYERTLLEIDKAFEIIEQVEPGLPEGWAANYSVNLDFFKYGPAPASEFQKVCELVEAAIDGKLEREATGGLDHQNLVATGDCKLKNGKHLYIIIGLYNVDAATCKITFKQETVTKVIADPACLGIESEEKTKENNI